MSPTASLETAETTVEAGGIATVPMTVGNDGEIVDEYQFHVVGFLAPWARVEPATVSVYPGQEATVIVTFNVPRSSEVSAGPAPYGVQVLPGQASADPFVAEGVVEVRPFFDTVAELVPRTSEGRTGGRHRVAVDNRGNTPIDVRLVAKDPEERLHLQLHPTEQRISPGATQVAELTVRPRERMWRGAETSHPFTVAVEPHQGPGVMLPGTHRQDPMLPGWSPKLIKWLIVLLLIGALIGALIGVLVQGAQWAGKAWPRVVTYVQNCAIAIPAGNGFQACLGVGGPAGVDDDGDGGGGGGDESAGEPESRTEELQVDVGPGETGEDVFSPSQGEVFTTTEIVLSASDEGVGTFRLSRDDVVIRRGTVQGFAGQTLTFPDQFSVTSDQQLRLEVSCSDVDEQQFPLNDDCTVTAQVTGEVPSSGG